MINELMLARWGGVSRGVPQGPVCIDGILMKLVGYTKTRGVGPTLNRISIQTVMDKQKHWSHAGSQRG